MINPDQWYSARGFAGFLGVHPVSIYQSQPHLGASKLPLPVPEGIRIGRSVRWTGRQILDYQVRLAQLSGVILPISVQIEPSGTVQKKGGRPRQQVKSAVSHAGGAA